MIVIACVDLENGMLFNHRRQSQDRVVRKNILDVVGESKLWMNEYSFGQFQEEKGNICVDENFMDMAGVDEYCFVENSVLQGWDIQRLILYRWERNYPHDFDLTLDLDEWSMVQKLEFSGFSHEKIVREIYVKR